MPKIEKKKCLGEIRQYFESSWIVISLEKFRGDGWMDGWLRNGTLNLEAMELETVSGDGENIKSKLQNRKACI